MQYKHFKINSAFNNCPGADIIKSDLAKNNLEDAVQFTEAITDDNDDATMVFEFEGNAHDAACLRLLIDKWQVDELDSYQVDGKTIVKIRWD